MNTLPLAKSLVAVRDLFDASSDDAAWRCALQTLGEVSGADQSTVYEVTGESALRDPLSLCAGSDPAFSRELIEDFSAINPYRAPQITSRMLSERRAFHGHELVSPQTLLKSRFYNEFMRHHNNAFHLVTYAEQLAPGVIFRFGHVRSLSRPFSDADRHAIDLTAPQLLSAARLRRSLLRINARETLHQSVVDAIADALVVIDERGTVQLTNARADELLAAGTVLSFGTAGLQVINSTSRDLLVDPVARILAAVRSGNGLTLECFAVEAKGHGRLYVTVSLLPSPAQPTGLSRKIHLAVFVREFLPTSAVMSEAGLRSTFGFTKAEARVADGLLAGLSTRDLADRLELQVDTVRQYVKQLLQKTGARRQSELLHIMVKAMPNLRQPDDHPAQ